MIVTIEIHRFVLTLFFDLDGTLLDHSLSEQEAALALYETVRPQDQTPEAFSAAWHAAQERYFERYLTGAISYLAQRRARMREVLGGHLSDSQVDELFEVYLEAYEKHWRIYPDVHDCLDRLGENPIGIITNGDEAQQRRKLRCIGLQDRFPHVLISGEVGVAKPNAEIFLEACSRAGSVPGKTIYVGDRLDIDALGAERAGLVGVWLNREGAPASGPGVHEIDSLEALPSLIDRLPVEPAKA